MKVCFAIKVVNQILKGCSSTSSFQECHKGHMKHQHNSAIHFILFGAVLKTKLVNGCCSTESLPLSLLPPSPPQPSLLLLLIQSLLLLLHDLHLFNLLLPLLLLYLLFLLQVSAAEVFFVFLNSSKRRPEAKRDQILE